MVRLMDFRVGTTRFWEERDDWLSDSSTVLHPLPMLCNNVNTSEFLLLIKFLDVRGLQLIVVTELLTGRATKYHALRSSLSFLH